MSLPSPLLVQRKLIPTFGFQASSPDLQHAGKRQNIPLPAGNVGDAQSGALGSSNIRGVHLGTI